MTLHDRSQSPSFHRLMHRICRDRTAEAYKRGDSIGEASWRAKAEVHAERRDALEREANAHP